MNPEILVPLVTPFRSDGRLDFDGYVANVHRLSAQGVDGVVLMGSSGEFPHLTHGERRQLISEVAAQRPDRFQVLVHSGGGAMADVIQLVEDTVTHGLDGAMVITPFYFQPQLDRRALVAYYRQLIQLGPIYLYHYPRFTGVTLDSATVGELAQAGLKGMKDSSGQSALFSQVASQTRGLDFRLFTGSGSAFLAAIAQGAAGGIMALAQLAPAELIELRRLAGANDWPAARSLQDRLVALDQATGARFGIAGLKWAAKQRGLVSSGPRPPLTGLDPAAEQTLTEILQATALEPMRSV
ncbi:MAG: dihydrodipicolinate synthase family protein [Sulfobacillus sp.]